RLDQLVGQKQRREKKLARFAQRAEACDGFAALGVDQTRGGTEAILLALPASDRIDAPGDRKVDHGRHQAAASRISPSSSSTTSRTLARNSSSRAATGLRLASARSMR